MWARPDVMPSVVMYAGIDGLSKGSIVRKGNKWVVCALAIEGDEEVAQVHQWNNPSVPVVVHHMRKMAEVLALVEEYLSISHASIGARCGFTLRTLASWRRRPACSSVT